MLLILLLPAVSSMLFIVDWINQKMARMILMNSGKLFMKKVSFLVTAT